MKKFFGMLAIVGAVTVAAPDNASAAGPFMITFPSFCDCITVRTTTAAGRLWIHGTWEWTCSTNVTLIHGVSRGFAFGTQPVAGGAPGGFSATFQLNGTGLFDLAGTFDGPTNSVFQDNQAYTMVAGTCPGQPLNSGKPSLIARQN